MWPSVSPATQPSISPVAASVCRKPGVCSPAPWCLASVSGWAPSNRWPRCPRTAFAMFNRTCVPESPSSLSDRDALRSRASKVGCCPSWGRKFGVCAIWASVPPRAPP